MKLSKLTMAIALLFTVTAFAQSKTDFSGEPGYFDYSQFISMKAGEATTEVYLEEPLLKMVAKMADGKQEGIGKLISNLKLVKVNEFNLDKNEVDKVASSIESMEKELGNKKWDRIIHTKKNTQLVNVYVKPTGQTYGGLFITMLDKKGKITFVNIVGLIDLETIGKLSGELKIPGLNNIKEGE